MKINTNYYKRELGFSWFKEGDVIYIWINLIWWQFQFGITILKKGK